MKTQDLKLSKYLTTKEAAEYLRTTVGSLRNRVCSGKIPYYKDGKRLLFKRADLDRLIETSRQGGIR